MTAGFDVRTTAVDAAAGTTDAVGAEIGGIDLAGGADAVAAALPGARTAGAASTLAGAWRTGIDGLARDVAVQAEGLRSAAANYTSADGSAASSMAAVEIPGL